MTELNHPVAATAAPAADQTAEETEALYGLLAEYETVGEVRAAALAMKEAGYRYFEVYSPFPLHGLEDALDLRPTILPWIVLLCGLTGLFGGLALTIHTMGDGIIPAELLPTNMEGYGYLISGKPLNSLPAWIPVVFECTILLSAFGAVFGMFLLNKLPLLYHPLFKHPRFRRATNDRFFIAVLSRDQKFEQTNTTNFLRDQGAAAVEQVYE